MGIVRSTLAFLVIASLVACSSSPPKPAKALLTAVAQNDVNPDAQGRASPIVVRVYQLRDDSKFAGADFFALFDDDQKLLGNDSLAREEIELTPGERRELAFGVQPDAKFVGVMAAYRDIRNAQWRALEPVPKKGLLSFGKSALLIDVARSKVSLSISK
jgi:type VI secretion system protein VasD